MVEFRAFFPAAVSTLPPQVLALLQEHLGLSLASPAASRTDAYALTASSRLGLKQRAIDKEGGPRDLELKVALEVYADGSQLLEKQELPPGTTFASAAHLTAQERSALAAAAAAPASALALVAKQRRQGSHSSELTELALTHAGRRSQWCTWCFEDSWRGTSLLSPRARGAALLQALQAAEATATPGAWQVCSFAGWLESACASTPPPHLPLLPLLPVPQLPAQQFALDSAAAAAAGGGGQEP